MGLYHGLVPSSKDIRAITVFGYVFGYVMSWPQLRILGPVHSFGYNMGLYHGLVPSSKKIMYNDLVPSSKDVRATAMFHYVTGLPQLRMPGPVHSFGYNMGLYHGLVPSSQDNKEYTARCNRRTKSDYR